MYCLALFMFLYSTSKVWLLSIFFSDFLKKIKIKRKKKPACSFILDQTWSISLKPLTYNCYALKCHFRFHCTRSSTLFGDGIDQAINIDSIFILKQKYRFKNLPGTDRPISTVHSHKMYSYFHSFHDIVLMISFK